MFADPFGLNSNVWGSDVREDFGGVQAAPPSAAARFAATGFRHNPPGSQQPNFHSAARASPPYSGYGGFPGTNKVGSAVHRTWLGASSATGPATPHQSWGGGAHPRG